MGGSRVLNRSSILFLFAILATYPCLCTVGEPVEFNIFCIDTDGNPLGGCNVTVLGVGNQVFRGSTNSSGWLSVLLPPDSYVVQVYWLGERVFLRNISLTRPSTLKADCNVSNLTLEVNFLGFIPVRHVAIIVLDPSGKVVYTYRGQLKIPYRLYRLSAETTIRLPSGYYYITVEMIGSEAKIVTLEKSTKITFTRVASLGSLFLLSCLLVSVTSCIGFLIEGHEHLKKRYKE